MLADVVSKSAQYLNDNLLDLDFDSTSVRYSMFVSAMIGRISRSMRLSGSFTPLGPYLYCRLKHVGPESTPSAYSIMARVFRLQVDCVANSRLVFSLRACVESEQAVHSDITDSFNSTVCSRAMLAPGGHCVELLASSIEGDSDPSLSSFANQRFEGQYWRRVVSSQLQSIGLGSSSDESSKWILVRLLRVKFFTEDDSGVSRKEICEPTFEWPAMFCVAASRARCAEYRHSVVEEHDHRHLSDMVFLQTLDLPSVLRPFEAFRESKTPPSSALTASNMPRDGNAPQKTCFTSRSEENFIRTPTNILQHRPSGTLVTYLSPSGSQMNTTTPASSSADFTLNQASSTPADFSNQNSPPRSRLRSLVSSKHKSNTRPSNVTDNEAFEACDVTEADFSFFDQPSSSQDKGMLDTHNPNVKLQDEQNPILEVTTNVKEKGMSQIDPQNGSQSSKSVSEVNRLNPIDILQKPHPPFEMESYKAASSRFRPLKFSAKMTLLDDKYTTFGQFVTPSSPSVLIENSWKSKFRSESRQTVPRVGGLQKPHEKINRLSNRGEHLGQHDVSGYKPLQAFHIEDGDSNNRNESFDLHSGVEDNHFPFQRGIQLGNRRLSQSNRHVTLTDPMREEEEEGKVVRVPEIMNSLLRFLIVSKPLCGARKDIGVTPSPDSWPFLSFDANNFRDQMTAVEALSVSRIVMEQILSTRLQVSALLSQSDPLKTLECQQDRQTFQVLVCETFPENVALTTQDWIELEDTDETKLSIEDAIFSIEPPTLHLQKANLDWEFSPVAVPFWESLGLAPSSGPKDIKACCIYPGGHLLKQSVRSFLKQVAGAYQSHRLGCHEMVRGEKDELDLVPISIVDDQSLENILFAFRESCIFLGKQCYLRLNRSNVFNPTLLTRNSGCELARTTNHSNTVVYIINPFSHPFSLTALSTAFYLLERAFRCFLPPNTIPNSRQIVLQIVSVDQIASLVGPRFLTFSQAATLAHEVYNKFSFDPEHMRIRLDMPIPSHSSIQLSRSVPTRIPFSLTSDATRKLFRQNSMLHIAYAIGRRSNWVTAAWVDDVGRYQYYTTYDTQGHQLEEILREIWDTTLDIVSHLKVHWRLFIAKVGVEPELHQLAAGKRKGISKEETEMWKSSFEISRDAGVCVLPTLLFVDAHPDIDISPPLLSARNAADPPDSPRSTPLSPLKARSFKTATDSSDPSARLVNETDRTNGILLASPRNVSPSILKYESAITSGLLLRKGQADQGLGYEICSISIIGTTPLSEADKKSGHGIQQQRRMARDTLREVLVQYRGLATLARFQLEGLPSYNDEGIGQVGTTPWHVAAAEIGVLGLEQCLPDGSSSLIALGKDSNS